MGIKQGIIDRFVQQTVQHEVQAAVKALAAVGQILQHAFVLRA